METNSKPASLTEQTNNLLNTSKLPRPKKQP